MFSKHQFSGMLVIFLQRSKHPDRRTATLPSSAVVVAQAVAPCLLHTHQLQPKVRTALVTVGERAACGAVIWPIGTTLTVRRTAFILILLIGQPTVLRTWRGLVTVT